jgi:hypothetical protein
VLRLPNASSHRGTGNDEPPLEVRVRRRDVMNRVSARTILCVAFAALVIYAFPGYMSIDSVHQLFEGRTGHFSNPHPPLMAAMWGVLDRVVSGPLLMLLLQVGLLLGGLYHVSCRWMPARWAALSASALLLFPPIAATMAVIWKDSQMAAFLVASVAAMLDRRRAVRLIGLALAAAACAFRHNGFAAAVPLIGLLFVWTPGLRWWKRYTISGAAAVIAVGTAFGVNELLTDERVFFSPAFADIVGVVRYTHPRSDEELREILRDTPLRVTTSIQATFKKQFSARNPYWVINGEDRLFDIPSTEAQRAAVSRAWRELIRSDLSAYLWFRWIVFAEVLGMSESELWSPVWNEFLGYAGQEAWIHHNAARSPLQAELARGLAWLATETRLFRPYLFALLALLMIALVCRDRVTFAVLVSGLLYEASFAVAGATPDHRYSHWMITCTCLAAVMLFARRYGARPEVTE